MKTISRFLARGRSLLQPHVFLLGAWAFVVVALERVGGRVPHDLGDLPILGGLMLLAGGTWVWHRNAPIPWLEPVERLGRRTWQAVTARFIQVGIDFRENPPLPSRLPGLLWKTSLAVWVAVAAAVVCRSWFPNLARELAVTVSYTLYLTLLGALWSVLLIGALFSIIFALARVHDLFVSGFTGEGRRPLRTEVLCHIALLEGLVTAAVFLPVWTPLAVHGAFLVLISGILATTRFTGPMCLWRPRDGSLCSHRVGFRSYTVLFLSIPYGALTLAAIASRGDRLLGTQSVESGMPVTDFLGSLLLWTSVGGGAAMTFLWLRMHWWARRHDPARPCAPVLAVAGPCDDAWRRSIGDALGRCGWRVRFNPRRVDATDVRVQLVSGSEPPEPSLFGARWPLPVTHDSIDRAENVRRYRRRAETQYRRLLLRGLHKLFKRAARRSYERGEGFLVAPQHWFVSGLARDDYEEDLDLENDSLLDGIIGPPYHRVLARPVRHYFHVVMTALEIDLVFVEDGVGFRRFRRVLECLFEVYDVFGGEQRAEEKHITGIPRVRAVIHDFTLEDPYRSDTYPEPDYDEIGRARILHVFLDRGDDDEPAREDAPADREDVPVAGMV